VFLPAEAVIQATVVIDPEKINLSNPSADWDKPYVVSTVSFSQPDKKRVADINASTVLLDNAIPPTLVKFEAGKFKAYFDRDVVVSYLWTVVYHMGYVSPFKNVPIVLTVTGSLNDGTLFSGSDTVYVSAR